MSQSKIAVLIGVLLLPLWLRLRRDFISGVSYAVVILVACTPLMKIATPGNLPEMTIHRLVLLSLVVAWIRQPRERAIREVPVFGWMAAWAILTFLSFLGSGDLVGGLKRYLDYVVELFAFYFVIATSVRSRDDAIRLLRSAVIGITLVALMAVYERYAGWNLVDRYISADPEAKERAIRATYRHRILLGTGMAMGFPLALMMTRIASTPARRRLAWLAIVAMVAACYFSMSRGPWLALILAAGVMMGWAGRGIRKPLILMGVAAIVILVARPGVYNTLFNKAADTVDKDSFKGGTFQYRLELWRVAYTSIEGSPWTFLFGLGPGAGTTHTVAWSLSYKAKNTEIWSWDNTLAYALFQYGFLGLIATMGIYGTVAWRLFVAGRARAGNERDLFICLCASTLALFFMMSNVLIFARQLYYLFWTLTALGMVALNAPATGAPEAWDDESDPAEREALEAGEPGVPEVDLLTRQQV